MTPFEALTRFADALRDRFASLGAAEPEEQLRGPVENLISSLAESLSRPVVLRGEHRVAGAGRPDYAVGAGKEGRLLVGFIELKKPGKGADPGRYKGHDARQWQRFRDMPNLVYSDGNAWALYRGGEQARQVVFPADLSRTGAQGLTPEHADALRWLLLDFFDWEPLAPSTPSAMAEVLAPLCRLLRREVEDSLRQGDSPLQAVAESWRQLLFPDADDATFADGYAQTVTFALLLARGEGADIQNPQDAVEALRSEHLLLSQALHELTVDAARQVIDASLSLLTRTVAAVPDAAMHRQGLDPWLYFYEHFLAAYDPDLRRNAGVYYTPREVVAAQVHLVDELLRTRLGKPFGFAQPGVVTLDPAVGTGAYLLGVIEHSLGRLEQVHGAGSVAGHATTLAAQLNGFEYMVGPYSVAQLRMERALRERGAHLPPNGPRIFLTDTMEAPTDRETWVPLSLKAVADQHRQALKVKDKIQVFVCLGNPPYDRHGAGDKGKGGWVRHGAHKDGAGAILNDFITPAKEAGHGGHLKNLYNLYVYFWRWALWKIFEHPAADTHPGVVSFITGSSYLVGKGFAGMREYMRRVCDEIWIVDLGGEGRGARREENVFDIQTPVAIAVAVRYGSEPTQEPARVRYARIRGTRQEKLARLAAVESFADIDWQPCASDWQAPFRPAGRGDFFGWPLLTDIMPWQQSGVQFKRTWTIAPVKAVLVARWKVLLSSKNKEELFRETGYRSVFRSVNGLFSGQNGKPVASEDYSSTIPTVARYGYRSFDRQFAFADNRLCDRMRPVLWQTYSAKQMYFASVFTTPLDQGPALTVSPYVPDLHYFNNRGAKDILPLYRDAEATEPNLLPGLASVLAREYGQPVTAEDIAAYCYGVLANPAYTERFHDELESCDIRLPLTRDPVLFSQAVALGRELVWLHTHAERWRNSERQGEVPGGSARCTVAVPGDEQGYPEEFHHDEATLTLHVGAGRFAPVPKAVWEYSVSGLQVVKSWLGYRMRRRRGRRSSPLDDIGPRAWTAEMTTELLALLWILERTVAIHPQQEHLLERIVQGPLFPAFDLPSVPAAMREAPERKTQRQVNFLE